MNLPLDLYSPDQLSMLTLECDSYIDTLRRAKAKAKMGSHVHQEPPIASELLQVLMDKNGTQTDDTDALEGLYKQLQDVMAKAPVVHLTLSVLPNRMYKRQLTVWFRTQVNPLTLLTFAERRDIGGGVIARAGSHVYDFSFRRRILDNKQRISELVNV